MSVISDLRASLRQGPSQGAVVCLSVTLVFLVVALSVGFAGSVFRFSSIDIVRWWFLPLTLFVFPSFLEELVFRGVLLRRNLLDSGWRAAVGPVIYGSIVFTLWHPINALTINPGAQRFFLDPVFLLIVFLLGIATGIGYLVSRSLWVPVLMHWLTVVIWVFLLGGRNLVMEG